MTISAIGALDNYRVGVQQGFAHTATLIMSTGMLAFTITYLMTHPQWANVTTGLADIRNAVRTLDWRWLTAACLPLMVLTYEGRGYNNSTPLAGSATSLGSDLAATFFVVLIVVTAFSFLLRHGVCWFIPVLIAQSLLIAAAGERTPIITDAIALVLMLSITGYRPSRLCSYVWASAVGIMVILAITGAARRTRTVIVL